MRRELVALIVASSSAGAHVALRVAAARSRIVASARFLTRAFLQSLDQRAAATFAGNIDL